MVCILINYPAVEVLLTVLQPLTLKHSSEPTTYADNSLEAKRGAENNKRLLISNAECSLLFSLFSVHVAQAPWKTVAGTLSNNAFICRPFISVTQSVKYRSTKRFCAWLTYLLGYKTGATGNYKIRYKIRSHIA